MPTTKTIDAHAEGGPLRLVVDGFPAPRGKTMADKLEWAGKHADSLRRHVMLPPRGHADLCGAVLTEPASPGAHAGVIFMDAAGFRPFSGHGILAVTAIALERGLAVPGGDNRTMVYDTAVGTVRATLESGSRGRVSCVGVPSFVSLAGVPVQIGARRIRTDVAFGGAMYAIVDSEAAGLPIDIAHVPELRRTGAEIVRAVSLAHQDTHPLDARIRGVSGAVFTAPSATGGADLRSVTIFAQGALDASPGGAAACAVMAVLDAMGLLDPDRPFVLEGLLETHFAGRVAGRTRMGEVEAIVPAIEGSAWITGEHTFLAADDDPLKDGCRLA
jgi:trans-L-3-hydroxyproline dehydratase